MPPVEHSITDNADTPEEERHKRTISRRKLLKALAAAGGAVAVTTLLPSKWAKPVVEVGVLPVHAQATAAAVPTDTPVPLAYAANCDSTPGGGNISIGLPSGTGRITNIRPYLAVISGTGPIAGITATMTAAAVPPSALPIFTPPLPRTAITDASGVADFGTLDVTGTAGQAFNLVFDFATPVSTPASTCGQYVLG